MYTFLVQEIMKKLINNDLPMSLREFFEVVKTKTIFDVGFVHDGLLTTLTLIAVSYLIVVYAENIWKNFLKKKDGKFKRVFTRSMSIGVLHGGELALERLVQYHEAKANFLLLNDNLEAELEFLLNEDLPDFKKLQRCVAKLEMSGKEKEAVEKLECAVREARSKGKPHEAYEFEMLLVETLIYKGDFEKARSYPCLKDQYITDARRQLYTAIIYLLLENSAGEAEKSWVEFKRIRKVMKKSGNAPDAQLFGVIKHFDKFKSVVESLKEDIKEAKQKNNN